MGGSPQTCPDFSAHCEKLWKLIGFEVTCEFKPWIHPQYASDFSSGIYISNIVYVWLFRVWEAGNKRAASDNTTLMI